MPASVLVSVPATTANIGPGFDCLGAALTLYNRFHFTVLAAATGQVSISVTGLEAKRVATDTSNLVYRAFEQFFQRRQQPPPGVNIAIELGVPLARGLGSSSTAIIGGLLGANSLAGHPLSQSEIAALATEIEGHPDNVVPALVGGCQLAAEDHSQWTVCPIDWHPEIIPVVAIPDFELSTQSARAVLPQNYSRADAIFNAAHLGLLLQALRTNNSDWLSRAMGDRIHQPYRQTLIPGYDSVAIAASRAGAHGLVISGAGPTLLALTPAPKAEAVRQAMATAWQQAGIQAQSLILAIDTQGAQVSESP
ncbi:homoserine kinase [filamentous cyanobacterium CCP5]|nr:homoserine kinase [filamentous cyanobacterium CCP5]